MGVIPRDIERVLPHFDISLKIYPGGFGRPAVFLIMNKFLVIGSAPYIREWYDEFGEKVLRKGYKLCPINNAWIIDPDRVFWWFHSNDFRKVGKVQPSFKVMQDLDSRGKQPHTGDYRYEYVKRGSGTMILNVLCDLLNYSLNNGDKCVVAIAGSDLIYQKHGTHFYGESTRDPLRYGEDWLVEELERVQTFYDKEGCRLMNVGLHDTLLPFRQYIPEDLP